MSSILSILSADGSGNNPQNLSEATFEKKAGNSQNDYTTTSKKKKLSDISASH
jgi:hypothetical protein